MLFLLPSFATALACVASSPISSPCPLEAFIDWRRECRSVAERRKGFHRLGELKVGTIASHALGDGSAPAGTVAKGEPSSMFGFQQCRNPKLYWSPKLCSERAPGRSVKACNRRCIAASR